MQLTSYEAKIYDALLKIDCAKVSHLAMVTSVPRAMIYSTLKTLLSKGLCVEYKGKITFYSAVAPIDAFQNILQKEKEMLQTKITAIQKLNKIYNEQKKTVIPHEGVRVFKGNQCREFIIKSINEASKEVLIFCKQSSHKVRNDLEIQALKRGVTFRCLYERACLNDSNFLPLCKKVLNRGEIGRTIGLLPMNMFVVDDTIAAVMEVDKEKKGMTIFVFNQPVLITAMKQNFQYLWLQGSDIKNV